MESPSLVVRLAASVLDKTTAGNGGSKAEIISVLRAQTPRLFAVIFPENRLKTDAKLGRCICGIRCW